MLHVHFLSSQLSSFITEIRRMKSVLLLMILHLHLFLSTNSFQMGRDHYGIKGGPALDDKEARMRTEVEAVVGGSSYPDCSHACGPCGPCKLVIVSYKCSVSEACPVVYKCLCKGKYYHVPSHA